MAGILRPALYILLMLIAPVVATAADAQPASQVLEVFVRDGCPHCAEAKKYLPQFARARPQLRIVYRSLDDDPRAADDLARHSRRAGEWPPGVPTFVIDGRVLVGFVSPEVTGPQLAALVDGGTKPPGKTEAAGFGDLSVAELGLPLFTIALGLIDGFNPCAMWVLLFLLSILVRLEDRRRMALIAGTFVLVSGAVYYAFMAAWLNLFLLVGLSDLLRWLLALIALAIGVFNLRDFFRTGSGYLLSIPESARPGLYARVREILRADTLMSSLLGVAVLAVLVNFIELLCTAGLPAIYTAVLAQQDLSTPAHYGYLALYILAYIADDALMVTLAVIALGGRKLSEPAGRWLKLLSGLVMLFLGAIMLLFPQLLI
ncbi:glutaredoxin domain-containing protein [Microbulbifer magnicolonia]|uniref:glutaredoxin domain-containing protein n=1 Tax=Microbulbifer magnicolonia TaxID=3109744 RepID=UPI002B409766|nr:glutaredoxin domain-containing protein [Microbulbifer sp. GG15]